MSLLRCKAIESQPKRGIFRIVLDDRTAPPEALEQVARIADLLLRENALEGRFVVASDGDEAAGGVVALELPESQRTFFHNGIVFAALDAVNDPIKNPTLTLLAEPSDE